LRSKNAAAPNRAGNGISVVTLYGSAQTPYTEKVRRALVYKGYDFELVEPRTPEDYKRFSPETGQLPLLDLNGESVPDSTAILMRIERDRPNPPLLSSDPTVSAQQQQLVQWADESLLYYYMKYRRLAGNELAGLPVASDEPIDPVPEPAEESPARVHCANSRHGCAPAELGSVPTWECCGNSVIVWTIW
jgi:glutathione S-transferase